MPNMQPPRRPHPANHPTPLLALSPGGQPALLSTYPLCTPRSLSKLFVSPLPLLQNLTSNDHSLDLASALVNCDDPRIPVHSLDIGLPRISYTPMNLHGLGHHAVHHLAGVQLRLGRRRPQLPRVPILKPGRMIDQPARRLDLRLHIRQHPLYGLKLSNGLPKRPPCLGVLHRLLQSS